MHYLTKDITGQRHEMLVAIKPLKDRNYGKVVWLIKCDCGKTTKLPVREFLIYKSCGCARYPNYIGKRFGKLVVQAVVGVHKIKHATNRILRCRCDCGNMCDVSTRHINISKSCGCMRGSGGVVDLTGNIYGWLTVIEHVGTAHGHANWRCRCRCGAIVDVMSKSLKGEGGKATRSCGCYAAAIRMSQAWNFTPNDIPVDLIKVVQLTREIERKIGLRVN